MPRIRDLARLPAVFVAAAGLTLALGAGVLQGEPSAPSPPPRDDAEHNHINTSSMRQEHTDNPMVAVHVFNSAGELIGPVNSPRVIKTDAQWKAQLTPEQYKIARNKGTERAFCGTLLDNKKDGVYACICCDLPLFASNAKFNSGTGWPSFFKPIGKENVIEHEDNTYGMSRVESGIL